MKELIKLIIEYGRTKHEKYQNKNKDNLIQGKHIF